MSIQISDVFVENFDAQVKLANQKGNLLDGKVRTKSGVIGKSHSFPKIGKGRANNHIRGNDVVPMNVDATPVVATLEDIVASEYVYYFDAPKLNFDETVEQAKTAMMAVGRAKDQLIIDAITAGYNGTNMLVGDGTAAFSLAYMMQAKTKLDKNGVSKMNRHLLVSPMQLSLAMQETSVGSADFNIIKPLVEGTLNRYAGFEITEMEDRDEGGLPSSTGKRYAYFWQKDQIGLAIGKELSTFIKDVPEKLAYLTAVMFSGGAVVIDDTGVGAIYTTEA